jgi:hypothetical protein
VTVLIPDDELPCVSFLSISSWTKVSFFFYFWFSKGQKSRRLISRNSSPPLFREKKSFVRLVQTAVQWKTAAVVVVLLLILEPLFFCPGPSFHLIQNGGSFVRLFPLAQLVCLFQHAHSGRLSESIEENRDSLLPSSSYIKDFLRWPTVCSFLAAILARLWWNFIFVVCVFGLFWLAPLDYIITTTTLL